MIYAIRIHARLCYIYYNHVSDRSVQCVLNPETRVHTLYTDNRWLCFSMQQVRMQAQSRAGIPPGGGEIPPMGGGMIPSGGGMAPGGGLPNRGLLPGGIGAPQNYPPGLAGGAGSYPQMHGTSMRGMPGGHQGRPPGGHQGGPPQHPPPQQQGYPRFLM